MTEQKPDNEKSYLDLLKSGRFPQVRVSIAPLGISGNRGKSYAFDKFISYQFTNNILVPVDSFTLTFAAPQDDKPFNYYVREGDQVSIFANDVQILQGTVDQYEIECDGDQGERVTINGRNMLGQLEDQNCVDLTSTPIWGQRVKPVVAVSKMLEGTKINKNIIEQDMPSETSLLATEAGETKLNAILRFLEPVNSLIWSTNDGRIVIGKPNMRQAPLGKFFVNRSKRTSNCLSMRATFSGTQIPNRYVGLWSSLEESTQSQRKELKPVENGAETPKRLLNNGYVYQKTVISSITTGADAAGLDSATRLASTSPDVLGLMVARKMAQDNFNELHVVCLIPGHYDEKGNPFLPDTVYQIEYDRADILENMYLYAVEYNCSVERGLWTTLSFCKLGTIVDGVKLS